MRTYSIIDLESGGLNPNTDAIVSIAIMILDENLDEIESYYTIIKDYPDKIIGDKALEVNGFNRRQIFENGKPIDDVLNGIKRLMANTIPVFHNAKFDAGFLNVRGMKIFDAIDTMLISRDMHPGQKASLSFVSERLGFSSDGAHNALYDVIMTANILRKFSEQDTGILKPKKINFDKWKI